MSHTLYHVLSFRTTHFEIIILSIESSISKSYSQLNLLFMREEV